MASTSGSPLEQLFVSLNNKNINTLINTISQKVASLIETARGLRAKIEQLAMRPNVNNETIKDVLTRVKAFKERIRGSLSKLNSAEANELGTAMGELETALNQLQKKGSGPANTGTGRNTRNASNNSRSNTRTGGPNVPPRPAELVSQALTLLKEPSALETGLTEGLSPQFTTTVSSVVSRVSQLSRSNPFGVGRLMELASLIRLGEFRGDILSLRRILRNIPAVLAMRATNLPNTPNTSASLAVFRRVAQNTDSSQQLSLSGSTLNPTDREQVRNIIASELPALRDELSSFSDTELVSLFILLGLFNSASELAGASVNGTRPALVNGTATRAQPSLVNGTANTAQLALVNGTANTAQLALVNGARAAPANTAQLALANGTANSAQLALTNRANQNGLVRFTNVHNNASVSSVNEELNNLEPSSPVPSASATAPAAQALALTNKNEIGSTAPDNRQAVESKISSIPPGTTLSTSDPAKITNAITSLDAYLGTTPGNITKGLKAYIAEKYSRNARSLVGEMGRKHKSVLLYVLGLANLDLQKFSEEIQKPIPNVSSESMNARSDTNERSKILELVMDKYTPIPKVLLDANNELIRQVNEARAQRGGRTRRGKNRRHGKRHTTRR